MMDCRDAHKIARQIIEDMELPVQAQDIMLWYTIEWALNKQIPREGTQSERDKRADVERCPSCGMGIVRNSEYSANYCDFCGQRIEWRR